MTISLPGNDNLAVEAHIRNFLNAIRGLEKPIAPPQAGYEAAVPGSVGAELQEEQESPVGRAGGHVPAVVTLIRAS